MIHFCCSASLVGSGQQQDCVCGPRTNQGFLQKKHKALLWSEILCLYMCGYTLLRSWDCFLFRCFCLCAYAEVVVCLFWTLDLFGRFDVSSESWETKESCYCGRTQLIRSQLMVSVVWFLAAGVDVWITPKSSQRRLRMETAVHYKTSTRSCIRGWIVCLCSALLFTFFISCREMDLPQGWWYKVAFS